jgi:exosortase/archaeosortase family protein
MNFFQKWRRIPRSVNLFFLKAFIIFLVWKTIYLFFLLPDRILDKPLTYSVADWTARGLNIFTSSKPFSIRNATSQYEIEGAIRNISHVDIYLNQQQTLTIADSCNGLELYVLYAGIILCFPAPKSRKFRFILGGFLLIYLFNIIRCVLLTVIYLHYPAFLDFSHHFLFTLLVGFLIFWLWYIFAKKLTFNARIPQ